MSQRPYDGRCIDVGTIPCAYTMYIFTPCEYENVAIKRILFHLTGSIDGPTLKLFLVVRLVSLGIMSLVVFTFS